MPWLRSGRILIRRNIDSRYYSLSFNKSVFLKELENLDSMKPDQLEILLITNLIQWKCAIFKQITFYHLNPLTPWVNEMAKFKHSSFNKTLPWTLILQLDSMKHPLSFLYLTNRTLTVLIFTAPAPSTEPPQDLAQKCDTSQCQLPYCFCSRDGTIIPGGLDPEDVRYKKPKRRKASEKLKTNEKLKNNL